MTFYAAAPLLALATQRARAGFTPKDERETDDAARLLADALGCSIRQVVRWRSGVRVRADIADRSAIALGVHPSAIWPEWLEAAS